LGADSERINPSLRVTGNTNGSIWANQVFAFTSLIRFLIALQVGQLTGTSRENTRGGGVSAWVRRRLSFPQDKPKQTDFGEFKGWTSGGYSGRIAMWPKVVKSGAKRSNCFN
jgi:hypothetical protein